MNRNEFDGLVAQAIAEAKEAIGEGRPSPARLDHVLARMAQRVESATRDYTLAGLRDVDSLAAEFGVSKRRIRALAANRHERFGVGQKVGRSWVWSAEEIEAMRPDLAHRPHGSPKSKPSQEEE